MWKADGKRQSQGMVCEKCEEKTFDKKGSSDIYRGIVCNIISSADNFDHG